MDGKNSRRSFLKGLLSVSVFSAASGLTFNRKTGAGFGEPGLIKKADAMNNPEYATGISDHEIKIEYFGMSCFLITTGNGTRIITDPFCSDKQVLHPELRKEPADVVTVSCGNYAHCYVYAVGGMPYIYRIAEPKEIKSIRFRGIATRHLEMKDIGPTRPGENIVMCFEVEGIKVCHLGALGHKLSNEQRKQIGKVDILMVPVGGVSALPVAEANEVCSQLDPKVIIPMHYRSDRCTYSSWATVDEFLKDKKNVINSRGLPERSFRLADLPAETQIIALGYPS